MKKFDKEYNKLLLETKMLMEDDNQTTDDPYKKQNQKIQQQMKERSSSSYDWFSSTLLPVLLGLGSVSMLFGQGIFGLGKHNKVFGGWTGQILGGLGAFALLPSLWSQKGFGQRLSTAIEKYKQTKDLGQSFKTFMGISSAADAVLKNGQKQISKNITIQSAVQKRKNAYIHNIKDSQQILKYLRTNGYKDISDLNILSENITMFLIKPQFSNQKKRYGEQKVNGIIVTNSKGTRAAMFNPADGVSVLNAKFISMLEDAFNPKTNTFLNGKPMEGGQRLLSRIKSIDAEPSYWLECLNTLVSGLRSIHISGLMCVNQLLLKFDTLPDIGIPLEIKQPQSQVVKQQEQASISNVQSDFDTDQSIKNLKQDPILNKFDEKIKSIQNENNDIYVNIIKQSIQAANQKDPDSYIIEGKIGNKTVYYARKPENNYLTDKIQQTVYFSKEEIQKLEGSGTPEIKLQNTLRAIKMPQIMKMKNAGLTLYIQSLNIEYLKRVAEVFKNEYNISL